jgi:hypothetical protein
MPGVMGYRALGRCLWLVLGLAVLSLAASPVPAGGPAGPRRPALRPLPVLVLAGQSNMVGWVSSVNDLSPIEQAPQRDVLFYGPDENGATWGPLTPPTVSGDRFGPELTLGQQLVFSGTTDLVAQVKFAVGGTNLASDWDPDRVTPYLYAQFLARVQPALAALQAGHPDRQVTPAGFFWMQGESDGQNAVMAADYAANLTRFVAHVRADLHAPWLPVFIGRIRLTTPYAVLVRQGQAEVAAEVPDVELIDTDTLPMAPDGLHYTSAGTLALGRAFAESFISWQASQHYVFLPVIPLS